MLKRLYLIAALVPAVFVVAVAAAQAQRLGLPDASALPAVSTSHCFNNDTIAENTSDPSTPYTVPSTGRITQFQTDTRGSAAGASVTFAVLRSNGGSAYTVVGVDTRTLPTPLPSSGEANFTLAAPMAVQAGDVLGVYSAAASCYVFGSGVAAGDSITPLASSGAPTTGESLSVANTIGASPSRYAADVSATFVPSPYDAGVSTSTSPANPSPGQYALLSSTVINHGPGVGPVTFTDAVPAGLKVAGTAAGRGTCAVSGQNVTCTISDLSAAQSASIGVLVVPGAAGSYVNRVAVSSTNDPNSANNSASATLKAVKATSRRCVVPKLTNVPVGVARGVLKDLGCKVKETKSPSRKVGKGRVIKTRPGRGTYASGRKVTLVVSSGAPKHKKHKKHHAVRQANWLR